ncbi:DUF1553 domain-containing protein [Lunatimonas salinarum]|uniref:DUF1553 domain-containing protein n=1 Tax=Lunatimonas salinarum TaxID=1774590 RepID=UPI001AE030F1|nr:DUF1553 domain-containing protein [Lunatimonas salinarum]
MRPLSFVLFVGFVGLFSCGGEIPAPVQEAMDELPEALDYNVHVKPVLSDKCFACHGPDENTRHAGLRLDEADAAFASLPENPGKVAIKPKRPFKSELVKRILSEDPDFRMPTPESHLTLTDREKAILIRWIEQGAVYKKHWSFIPLETVAIPQTKSSGWGNNEIDRFVLAELEVQGLKPSPEADKETLLRRISLDITGLPPTEAEIDAFLADNSPEAYERQVDRLLASPHYGEKMAMHWLDVARYADTHGYTVDRYRDMSLYRDWVIKAFNQNMRYDTFVTQQLAGDLLPNPTKEQLLATAFNRVHPQNMEGGIVDEEFRVEYVADRTNTLGKAFMALTLECARCHDHKYDPISQKNYFELSSFFNQVDEAGQISWDNAMPVPTMLWTDEEKEKVLKMLESNVQREQAHLLETLKGADTVFSQWLAGASYQSDAQSALPRSLKAHLDFDALPLTNALDRSEKALMESSDVKNQTPELADGLRGSGVKLNGDFWIRMEKSGVFTKSEPFSVSIWVNIPKEREHGAIFHTGTGAVLYNRRGYHLYLKENRLELVLAHTAPYNAIIKETLAEVPKDQWVNLVMTYDGSSKASGLNIYQNGVPLATTVVKDNLYKDIVFQGGGQPGIQVGAVWRGRGIKNARVDELMVFDRELTELEALQLGDRAAFTALLAKAPEALDQPEKELLKRYFIHNHFPPFEKQLQVLTETRMQHAQEVEPVQEVMVMQDMEPRRPTYLLVRGEYQSHGEEVFPNTPESVLELPENLPKNRLGLAQWLTDRRHPLTARVAVNRLWMYYFGRGLVASAGDFGNQGDMPSHPELLDWLSLEFMESGWDVKALQKKLLLSATYRQHSFTSDELRERDPDNILLARGPSGRMPGEMIRDNALMASGLLSQKIGGPSVKPYQPEGLWRVNGGTYVEESGENLYRRSLYTFWKRSVPHPTTHIFDVPDRSESVAVRQETNTPLQALVLLNDPTFVEAAKVLGAEMATLSESKEAINRTFRKLTGRTATEKELEILDTLRAQEYKKFQQSPEKAKGWVETGAYAFSHTVDLPRVAAHAVVASAIMNSDAAITKR